jgi:hypothetical protein
VVGGASRWFRMDAWDALRKVVSGGSIRDRWARGLLAGTMLDGED